MIDKREILEAAERFSLNPHVVEKDYVLGWMLAGIYEHPALRDSWVFKGGTCLKKCFFETYRFSEDLDFTLRDPSHLDEAFLKRTFAEVGQWITEKTGLDLPHDKQDFEMLVNPRGNPGCQGKISYCGPVSSRPGLPRVKLDLTADEHIVLEPLRVPIFHPYSDAPENGIEVLAYDYVEAFAEKFRALAERTHPRDLYDVVHLFRNEQARPDPIAFRNVLEQKCAFKGIGLPAIESLAIHRPDLEAGWTHMLNHQLPALLPVDAFWNELPLIFAWLNAEAPAVQLAVMPLNANDEVVRERIVFPTGPGQSHIEIVRFAAANRLIVELDYVDQTGKRSSRAIEAYSLRRTRTGNVLLMAVREADGAPRSYRIENIRGAVATQRTFLPRYPIELTPSGFQIIPATARQATNLNVMRGSTRTSTRSQGPTYRFRCAVCDKVFPRKSYDASLNAHKDKNGWPCSGRYGVYVNTSY